MTAYVLSPEAVDDLQDIFNFTQHRWGEAQAEAYINDLYAAFERLTRHSRIGRARPELGEEIRSLPSGAHVIFFAPFQDNIAIVRVLHGARDVSEAFGQ